MTQDANGLAMFQSLVLLLPACALISFSGGNQLGMNTGFGLLVVWFIFYHVRSLIIFRRIKREEYERLTNQPNFDPPAVQSPPPDYRRNETVIPNPTVNGHGTVSANERAKLFEHEVASIFNVGTAWRAVVAGGSGDGGVDILLFEGNRVVGVVQCKMYKGVVPPMFVRELATVRQVHNAKIAYLVTTGYFSDSTREEAKRLNIKLVDHEKLQELRQKARQRAQAHRAAARGEKPKP
jgi:hypothetical protein